LSLNWARPPLGGVKISLRYLSTFSGAHYDDLISVNDNTTVYTLQHNDDSLQVRI